METHRADAEDAATTGRGPGARRNRGAPPLPLAARRVLWERTWDRLLGEPPTGPAPAVRGEPGEGRPGTRSAAEGGAR